jgi:hypothetical protein
MGTLIQGTVPASISGGFDVGTRNPGSPTMPLLTPAAAQERLADAPIDAVSHRRVESVIDFVATMLIGATRRSNGDGRVRR